MLLSDTYRLLKDEERILSKDQWSMVGLQPEEWFEVGTFVGTSREEGKVMIHRSGFWSFNGLVFFDAVTVDGKSGTLVMSAVGKRADVFTDWQGKWVILSGTGDLASLRGQGTWWGPGAPDVGQWGDIYYSGKTHFEP